MELENNRRMGFLDDLVAQMSSSKNFILEILLHQKTWTEAIVKCMQVIYLKESHYTHFVLLTSEFLGKPLAQKGPT